MDHPIDVAAAVAGSQVALADALGVTRAAVNQWKNDGRQTPIEHCAEVERLSGGAVRRWQLRPADWHRIWPELIGAQGAPSIEPASHPEV